MIGASSPAPATASGYDDAHELEAEGSVGWLRVWRHLRTDPAFWVGAVMIVSITAGALFADLAPYDPNHQIRGRGLVDGRPQPPSAEFLLGTDRLGRDYFSRLLHGARTSLIVGVGATAAATLVGAAVGSIAAFVGSPRVWTRIGRRSFSFVLPVEGLLMRFTDVVLSLPALLVAILLVAIIGPSMGLVLLVIAGILWTSTARIAYSRVRQITSLEFVEAAWSLGLTRTAILIRHVLPHTVSLLVVYATLGIAAAVLLEAGLSFLGIGVPPPAASWGGMITEHASYYRTDPRLVMVPGFAIMATVLAFNLVGDALRDAMDPRGSDVRAGGQK